MTFDELYETTMNASERNRSTLIVKAHSSLICHTPNRYESYFISLSSDDDDFYDHHDKDIILHWAKRVLIIAHQEIELQSSIKNLLSSLAFLQWRHNNATLAYHYWHIALILDPTDPSTFNNLGFVAQKLNLSIKAMSFWQRATVMSSNFIPALANLSKAYCDNGDFIQAEKLLHEALSLDSENAELWSDFGIILDKKKNYHDAKISFQKALALDPQSINNWNNLASLEERLTNKLEAIQHISHAIILKPDFVAAHYNRAVAQQSSGDLIHAHHSHKITMCLDPAYISVYGKFGDFLQCREKWEDAIIFYRRALVLNPNFIEAHANYSLLLLALGNFQEGWIEYEWRWKAPDMTDVKPNFHQPAWEGEEAQEGRLLIYAEQGFGDSLQFCRLATLVAQRGWRIILLVPSVLKNLLESLEGIELVLAEGDELPDFDRHCAMVSLPRILNLTLETIPKAYPYLSPHPSKIQFWKEKIDRVTVHKPKIGLVWAGNPRYQRDQLHAIDQRRSMSPSLLISLLDSSDYQFFSLQKDATSFPQSDHNPLIDFMSDISDFEDSAAFIMSLDLVISVDTAVAHLASAIGKPVWLMDRYDSCWRWLKNRSDSPWYPHLRIFRQKKAGDWQGVIHDIRVSLKSTF
jgi:tetratricopeptide (TPR) repeat protein